MNNGVLYHGDCLRILSKIPENSVDMCLCSPPYYQMRDYGTDGQIWDGDPACQHEWGEVRYTLKHKAGETNPGKESWYKDEGASNDKGHCFCKKCGAWKGSLGLEPTPELYNQHLCHIFDEIKRVLKPTGTCFVNLGDTYSGGGLCQIPARFSLEMANRGWILISEVIWHKKNCTPSSAKRRFTVDFEKVFFFAKSKKYFFERQFEPLASSSKSRARYGWNCDRANNREGVHIDKDEYAARFCNSQGRNRRSVWSLSTSRFTGDHFASYPEALCEIPIKAGCPEFVCRKCAKPRQRIYEKVDGIAQSDRVQSKRRKKCGNRLDEVNTAPGDGMIERYRTSGWTDCGCNAGFTRGIVLDPFAGTGTSLAVARKLGRFFVGCELNPDYCRIIEERLKGDAVPPATCDQAEEKCPSIGVSE